MTKFSLLVMGFFFSILTGCGSSPIKANFLSSEKNIWINEPEDMGLMYCLANADGSRVDPVCYRAKRGVNQPASAIAASRPPLPAPASVSPPAEVEQPKVIVEKPKVIVEKPETKSDPKPAGKTSTERDLDKESE